MKREEALSLLSQVCAMFKGTLQEHTAIQQALEVVKKIEEPKVEEVKNN